MRDPHRLYQHIYRFLANMWFTDVCLIYSPPLIALAAVTHAASRCKENIDQFIMSTVMRDPEPRVLEGLIATTRSTFFLTNLFICEFL